MLHYITVSLLIFASLATTWKEYTDTANNVKFKYPEGWEMKEASGALAFLSPKENAEDMFQENVNLMVQDLSAQPMTLEEFTAVTKQQTEGFVGIESIVSLKDATFGGQKGKEYIYNMTLQEKPLKVKQYWTIKNNKVYLFTYTALPETFAKYEAVATEMMLSLKFL